MENTMKVVNRYLHEAAAENEEAVLNLTGGDVGIALEVFDNALNIIEQLQELVPYPITHEHPLLLRQHRCTSVDVPLNTTRQIFCFDRAIIFASCLSDSLCSLQDLAFYKSIVLFNMAVSHQMLGNGAMKRGIRYLKRSIRFYKDSYKALQDFLQDFPFGVKADADLLRVAALNNAVTILIEMADYKEARLLLDAIRTNLSNSLILGGPVLSEAFSTEAVEGFLLNMITGVIPMAAATA